MIQNYGRREGLGAGKLLAPGGRVQSEPWFLHQGAVRLHKVTLCPKSLPERHHRETGRPVYWSATILL
jgi:hypothetical protein